ncbi:Mu transposase C-terminal domain-containing protein [Pseudaminobacter sp. 19-2017]|uniref:Mu transposase C-terminal domain-containing protein n=2 Tax=Pseudaminobacter soli (ex Zhang et al. 2022) TaxID=2831468 RepID=A0A942I4L4_9HYPH|nr:Mu transposase C-terminal domain-containing protein [Pseudaminobacter soli]
MKRLGREILAAFSKTNSERYKRGSPIREWASAGVPGKLSRAPITSKFKPGHDFGNLNDLRRIQHRGVRFLNLYYRSEKLARLYKQVGRAHVRIKADLENLGTIWVAENRRGADWISASCECDMEGVSAAVWSAKVAALRRNCSDIPISDDGISDDR